MATLLNILVPHSLSYSPALRSVEKYLGLEKLYVLGTNCGENLTDMTDRGTVYQPHVCATLIATGQTSMLMVILLALITHLSHTASLLPSIAISFHHRDSAITACGLVLPLCSGQWPQRGIREVPSDRE